jgi:hypothetical protein
MQEQQLVEAAAAACSPLHAAPLHAIVAPDAAIVTVLLLSSSPLLLPPLRWWRSPCLVTWRRKRGLGALEWVRVGRKRLWVGGKEVWVGGKGVWVLEKGAQSKTN